VHVPLGLRRWIVRAVVAGCVFGAVLAFALLTDRSPDAWVVAGSVVAVLAVVWLGMDTIELADPPDWSLYRSASPARTFDPRFSRLSQELAEAADRQGASLALHQSLADVADTILLEKYDVDRARAPAAADEILGEPVTAYLASEPGTERVVFSPALFDVLDRLESL
jgi:hypothetical protein